MTCVVLQKKTIFEKNRTIYTNLRIHKSFINRRS